MLLNIVVYRNSSNDILLTQIDVFEEGCANDSEQLEVGEIDLQNPKDMFSAVYEKVRSLVVWNLFGRK